MIFLLKKFSFIEIIRPKQKTPFSVGTFSAVLPEDHASFSEETLRKFFCDKKTSFCCSIKHFWDFRGNTFCSAFKTSVFVSGRYSRRVFSRFQVFVGKNWALLSRNLLHSRRNLLSWNFPWSKWNFVFWTFTKRKASDFWSTLFGSSVRNACLVPIRKKGKKLTEKIIEK